MSRMESAEAFVSELLKHDSYESLAKATNTSVASVRQRAARYREKLAEHGVELPKYARHGKSLDFEALAAAVKPKLTRRPKRSKKGKGKR